MEFSAFEKSLMGQTKVAEGQAIIIGGIQNDFAGPDVKIPLAAEPGWLGNVRSLVTKFREFAENPYVVFVRSELSYEEILKLRKEDVLLDENGNVTADEATEAQPPLSKSQKKRRKKKVQDQLKQLWDSLTRVDTTGKSRDALEKEFEAIYQRLIGHGPVLLPNSKGAEFVDEIQELIKPEDFVLVKTEWSALKGTSLLHWLRIRRITQLYFVGCLTNVSIYATARDAAMSGFKLHLIHDCLASNVLENHQKAMKEMILAMGAHVTSAQAMVSLLEGSIDADDSSSQGLYHAGTWLEENGASTEEIELWFTSLLDDDDEDAPQQVQVDDPSMNDLETAMASTSLNGSRPGIPDGQSLPRPQTGDAASGTRRQFSSGNLRTYKSSRDMREGGKNRLRVRKRLPAPALPDNSKVDDTNSSPRTSGSHSTNASRNSQTSERNRSIAQEAPAHQPLLTRAQSRERNSSMKEPTKESKSETASLDMSPAFSSGSLSSAEIEVDATISNLSHNKSSSILHDADSLSQTSDMKSSMENSSKRTNQKIKNLSNLPALGPNDIFGEGDSFIKYNLLGKELRDEINPDIRLSDTIFCALYHEVQWQKMYHLAGEVPRLVAVQGAMEADGSKPIYRHPSDQSPSLLPFSTHVDIIRQEAEKVVGHPLNHVLIQLYRSGQDYISEHSDKSLDIKRGSSIVNVSFGAQRTMRLRTKRSAAAAHGQGALEHDPISGATKIKEAKPIGTERVTQRIHMPHNSIFVLGLKTNQFWLHGINQDRRADRDRLPEELAYDAKRISLTFRLIDTFLNADDTTIWGQGATSKTKEDAKQCINADEGQAEKLIEAFGFENKEGALFDWDEVYGTGFDILNMKAAPFSAQGDQNPSEGA